MEPLQPKGPKSERVELVAELEIDQAITIYAERLAGVPAGADLPYGYRGRATRELLIVAAGVVGVAQEANRRARDIRERASQE
jgi:hypothetical protein